MALLTVDNLKKIYASKLGIRSITALEKIDFSVEKGEYIAIMGESGSGDNAIMMIVQ